MPAIGWLPTSSRCRIARGRSPAFALVGLALWALINGGLVIAGFSEWPLVSLALGFAGAGAIIVMGTLLARDAAGSISCAIAASIRSSSISPSSCRWRRRGRCCCKTGLIADIGTISLIVTVAGVVGALAIWRLALALHANFLFERPGAFWIAPKKAGPVLQAAE